MHWPRNSVSDLGSGIGLFIGFLTLYLLVLEACPLFPAVGIFDLFPSGGRDGFDLNIPQPFLGIYFSCVDFAFCVFCN